MTQTRPTRDLKKSPFYSLFKKHPWLVPFLMMARRQLGIWGEFIEVQVKPFARFDFEDEEKEPH